MWDSWATREEERGVAPPISSIGIPEGTSAHGFTNEARNIKIVHGHIPEHDRSLSAGNIKWATNVDSYFQANFAGPGTGFDIGQAYQTLDLRVSLQALEVVLPEKTDFSIQLAGSDESLSDAVRLQEYSELRGPVGGPGGLHPILQTVRIPLDDFHSTLSAIRGVRFTFDRSLQGAVYLANIELSQKDAVLDAMTTQLDVPESGDIPQSDEESETSNTDEPVVIELYSSVPFPVRNAMPMLRIGDQRIFSGGPVDADLHRMSFSVTTDQWKAFSEGAEVVLQYGDDSDRGPRWLFGPFIRKHLRMEAIQYIHLKFIFGKHNEE